MKATERISLISLNIASALLLCWGLPVAAGAISSVSGGCRPTGTGPIFLSAGKTTDLTVQTLVLPVQSVDDMLLAGVSVRLGERSPAFPTGFKQQVKVTVASNIRNGDAGKILVRFSDGNNDSFPVKLVGEATIRSMSIEGGRADELEVGRDATLVLRGAGMSIYDPPSAFGVPILGSGRASVSVLDRTGDDQVRLRLRGLAAGPLVLAEVLLKPAGCNEPRVEVASGAAITLKFVGPPGDFCFGALGQQCGKPIFGIPTVALCAGGRCGINGGSWAHDECCAAHKKGFACQPDLGAQDDGQNCGTEMAHAVRLAAKDLYWFRQVDFSRRNATGRVVFSEYCAPKETPLPPSDGNRCCSGRTRPLNDLEKVALASKLEPLVICQ